MVTTLNTGTLRWPVFPPANWPGISITRLPAPGRRKSHPQALEVQASVAEFARHWEINPPTFEAYNTMFPFVYPATSVPRLITIGKIFCIFFYLDDVLLDVVEAERPISKLDTIGSCLRVFQTGHLPAQATRLEQAVRQVRQEILGQANEEWLMRFGATVVTYLQSSRQVSARPHLGAEFATLENYLHFREMDSGTYTGMDLIEFAQDSYLPIEVLGHPAIQDLRQRAAWVWAGMNDLISYHKEIALNRPGSNIISWLVTNQKLTLDTAANEVVRLVNSLVADFKSKVAGLPTWGEAELDRAACQYVMGLQDLIAAAWHWQLSTPRYRSPGSLIIELRSGN